MEPVFSPKDGRIDVSRLRVIFDDIGPIPGFRDSIEAGIKAWEGVLGVAIVNLELDRPATSLGYVIRVGKGAHAIEPNKSMKISYVGPTEGYFFSDDADVVGTAIHEFGHLLGLGDRYYEGYLYDDRQKAGARTTVPMSKSLFEDEADYDPDTNVMAHPGKANWTVSQAQKDAILSGKGEGEKPRHVVGVFHSTQRSGAFHVPSSMHLEGNQLYGLPGQRIAGYSTALKGTVCRPRADEVAGGTGNQIVRELWRLRHYIRRRRVQPKRVRLGKRYRGVRISLFEDVPGERIHRKVMSDIGKLARGG